MCFKVRELEVKGFECRNTFKREAKASRFFLCQINYCSKALFENFSCL